MTKLFFLFLLLFATFSAQTFAQIPSGYYDNAKGQSSTTLQKALHKIIRGHTKVSYTQLWTSFQSTDKKPNGKVWDMYSDVPGGTPAYEFTYTSDQCGTYSGEGGCYNREHSFPKSWWGGTTDTMYTDLFHIVPTDGYVNNKRSSYPYGEVGTASWTSTNGCKLGTSNYPGYSGTVFEPIDAYKGDFARNYFYMATRYLNKIDSWAANTDMLDGSGFSSWALNLLLDWNHQDPVSQKELDRNEQVYGIQHNRNPFIDHPEFVQRIWGGPDDYAPIFYDTYPAAANIATTNFDVVASLDEVCTVYYVVLADGATAPSSAQVLAGKDAAGTLLAANLRGSFSVSSPNQEFSSTISSLATTTAYDVYIVAEDNASPSNLQSSPSKVDVTTGNSGGSSGSSGSIVEQNFESGNWNYTSNAGSGTIAVTTSKHYEGSSSIQLTGSNGANSDPNIVFDNVDISSYTSVTLELAFAADGPDGSDDLYLDISYDNGATWNGAGSVKLVDGYGNASIAFGTTSSSNPTTVSSNPYTVNIADAENQIKIRIRFDERSGKNNTSDSYFVDAIKLKGTSSASANSNASIIEKTSGWSEPTNIAYASYSAASGLTTGNSIEVAGFTIKDGDGSTADADAVSTTLTDLSVAIDNWDGIKTIALVDGSTNVAEVTSVSGGNGTVSFSGLSLVAPDNGAKDFSLRATFENSQTDNQNIKYTITSATADNSGSTFAASDAGGAATDNTGDNNKIVVSASQLAFTLDKPGSGVTVSTDFEVEVKATDANDNVDLDAANSVTLALASGSGILSSATGLVQNLTSGTYLWTDVQYDTEEDFTLSATASGLTTATSSTITASALAPATYFSDLIITQYVEGSSNNKYLELWNNTGASVDLSNYKIDIYSNGSTTVSTHISLSGSLADQGVFVIANSSAAAWSGTPDLSTASLNFNGNDAVVLVNNLAKGNVDVLGTIGSSSNFAKDKTLKRNSDVSGPSSTYNASDWTASGKDDVSGLGNPGPLPIELISFDVKVENQYNLLAWSTATETRNDFFTLQRSSNLIDFVDVARILGGGNSNVRRDYLYKDYHIIGGEDVFYRLKQTDFDGKYSYSKIIAAVNKNTLGINRIYYFESGIYIDITSGHSEQAMLELMNLSGKIIFQRVINLSRGTEHYHIAVPKLANGIYFLRIASPSSFSNQRKLIISGR